MYLKHIELKNFGPHRHLDAYLAQGLVGITGRNGSGKSTVLGAVVLGLTGSYEHFDGIKPDNVNNVAGPDEESSVLLELEHDGAEMSVFRGLRRPEKSWLRVAGRTYTRAPDIAREINERLGVGASKLLSQFVVVRQGQLFSFLTMTPGDRAEAFQVLSNTGKAAAVVKAIEATIASDASLRDAAFGGGPDVAAVEELQWRVDNLTGEMAAVREKLDEAGTKVLRADTHTKARTVVQQYAQASKLDKEIEAAKGEHTRRAEAAREALQQKHSADADAKAAADSLAALRPAAHLARAALLTASRMAQAANQLAETRRELKEKVDKLAELKAATPVLHLREAERVALGERQAAGRARYKVLRATVDTLTAEGVVACPTCGTPVGDLGNRLDAFAAEIEALDAEDRVLRVLLGRIDESRQLFDSFLSVRRDLESAKASLEDRVEALERATGDDGPTRDPEDLQAEVAAADDAERVLADATARATSAGEGFAAARGAAEAAGSVMLRLVSNRLVNAPSAELAAKATAAIARHEEASVIVAEMNGRLDGLRQALASERERLKAAETVIRRSEAAAKFVERVRELQAVMHRQGLPQWVAQSNLRDVQHLVNENLGLFGAPFWVEATEDLSFTAHFSGRPPVSATRLSDGQKSVLALSFRPAVATLFGADVGFMALDEPTSALDGANRTYLAEALTRYAAQVRGRRQLLVVTHADELSNSFDQVVHLGGA